MIIIKSQRYGKNSSHEAYNLPLIKKCLKIKYTIISGS